MLRMFLFAAFLAGAGFTTPAPAQDQMTAQEKAAIVHVLNRGAMIFAYDQAAWHGTDDMVAKIPHPEEVVGGWIVDGPVNSPELVFFDKNEAAPHAVYVANFKDNKLVSSRVLSAGDGSSLSTERLRMISARAIAKKALAASNEPRCQDKPYNTVVLPPETPGGPIPVYLLTPQTSNDSLPFGGHYLTEVSADGRAGPFRHFTKSCAEFPIRDGKGKDETKALIITHLLDPIPTEIHVFSSLSAGKGLYVFTPNDRTWSVEGNQIRLVDAGDAEKKQTP